jgi:hypothetical protein
VTAPQRKPFYGARRNSDAGNIFVGRGSSFRTTGVNNPAPWFAGRPSGLCFSSLQEKSLRKVFGARLLGNRDCRQAALLLQFLLKFLLAERLVVA